MAHRLGLSVALASLSLSLLMGHTLAAQTPTYGVIAGRVSSDSAGAHGLANAEVLIPALNVVARANWMGDYRVAASPGRYLVMVRQPGFKSAGDSVTVVAARAAQLDFVLDRSAVRLDSVVTRAEPKKYLSANLNGFEERMRSHAGGYFVSDSVLRQNESRRLSEVMESRLGGLRFIRSPIAPIGENPDAIWAVSTRTNYSACGAFQKCPGAHGAKFPDLCYSSVYVDGVMIYDPQKMTNRTPPDLNMFNTTDVAGVEFYPGAASTPAEFTSNPCGVMAIWTREK